MIGGVFPLAVTDVLNASVTKRHKKETAPYNLHK